MALCQRDMDSLSSSSSSLLNLLNIVEVNESAAIDNSSVAIFEPLSDSCGESDMEGLDFSLFEPQVESNCCRRDLHVYSGTLDLLMHNCGKRYNTAKNFIYLYTIYIYKYIYMFYEFISHLPFSMIVKIN